MPEIAAEQGGRARAIDIIIPENRDGFARGDGICQPGNRAFRIDHHQRVGHRGFHARFEEIERVRHLRAAPRENARERVRQAMDIGDGLGPARSFRIKAIHPRPLQGGARDFEEGRFVHRFLRNSFRYSRKPVNDATSSYSAIAAGLSAGVFQYTRCPPSCCTSV